MPDSKQEIPDNVLVDRVRSGDSEAFDEIDRRYRGGLCRFLARYTFCVHQAEELGQRTLIRAFEMIGQLKSGEKLVGWLHRIAFRLAAAENRSRRMVSLESMEGIEPPDRDCDLLDQAEQRRNIWKLAEKNLSREEFAILELRYREDLSLSEIAVKMNKKEGAVRVQLHRARKKLLPLFHEFSPHPDS